MNNVRELALRLLCEWEAEGKYINLSLSSHYVDSLDRNERAALTALIYTAVENKIRYDYYISAISKRPTAEIEPRVLNVLRLGACQICDMDSIPNFAAVNETVKLARHKGESSFVNAVLRELSRRKKDGALPLPPYEKNPARHYSVKYSFPLWLVRKFIAELGEEEAVALLSSFNKIPPTDLTVNTLKISREEYLKKLTELGFSAEASPLSDISIRLHSGINPKELYGFGEGLFFVQDEASCLAAMALGAKAGDTVIDVCSCPGGKSFASAILMGNVGKLYSFDLHESKLSLVKDGALRLGLDSVYADACDAKVARPELFGTADKLIVDVPCSGLGVISKKADLRYRSEEGMSELPALQLEILESSVRYLKAGGELIYSTCTLSKEENDGVVAEFLSRNSGFSLVDFEAGALKSSSGMLHLYPHVHGTDGFFIAKLRKNK